MASFNSVLFLTLLVAISALMAAPSAVEAGFDENEVVNVTGTVPCAVNPTYSLSGTLRGNTFPNATVELRCGRNDTIVASNTTNANGTFSILVVDPRRDAAIVYLRTPLNCTVVVPTPLSTCNSSLTVNGTLESRLTYGPIIRVNATKMFILFARRFRFVNQPI
ncbi:hypothetical protein POM88_015740 [Heracleum sosnowskyi]|uniref:Uncharacterized protein n=1 Tax=Heracleum sosnowskyi TaxID=360622 RepID=A0AAD8IKR3_9APIA|nr:hypothetical protein POM88_015740 [Heracleum sosnowskyi]